MSLTLVNLLSNKKDKPQAGTSSKQQWEPARKVERGGENSTKEKQESSSQGGSQIVILHHNKISKIVLGTSVGCQLFILPSKDTELTMVSLFFSLPWTREKSIFECLFMHIRLPFALPPPQTTRSSRAPQHSLCLPRRRPLGV